MAAKSKNMYDVFNWIKDDILLSIDRFDQTRVAENLIINFRNQYSKKKDVIDLYCTLNYELGDIQHRLLQPKSL
jgi:acyl CoA:acetate/3-ketoacid CoA transferase